VVYPLEIAKSLKTLEEILVGFQKAVSATRIILASSTPVSKRGSVTEEDQELNKIVIDRNTIVDEIGKYNIKINDLYTAMNGKSEYRIEDGFHYNEQGQKEQGRLVATMLKSILAELEQISTGNVRRFYK
jgi:lysophospholipase L1-like esterase